MKNVLTLTLIAVLLFGCNREKKDPKITPTKVESTELSGGKVAIEKSKFCDIITMIFSKFSPEDQYEWLKKYGDIVCDLGMDECIIEMHTIKDDVIFQRMKDDFWNGKPELTSEVKVSAMKKLIGTTCYENHVEFTFDSTTDNMDLTTALRPFATKVPYKTYYSAPLFRALINKYKMSDTDEFVFTKAKNGSEVVVVFNLKVNGRIIPINLDITDNPTFTLKLI